MTCRQKLCWREGSQDGERAVLDGRLRESMTAGDADSMNLDSQKPTTRVWIPGLIRSRRGVWMCPRRSCKWWGAKSGHEGNVTLCLLLLEVG